MPICVVLSYSLAIPDSRFPTMANRRLLLFPLVAFAAACNDSPVAPARVAIGDASLQNSAGRGVFQRYVAIGTSISMGWASDGAIAVDQHESWPAQLARLGGREISQPYIASPGCRSPLRAPLALLTRLSGEPALAPAATLSCAPNVDGVTLPTQNVAVVGARVADALFTTPENALDPADKKVYARVLAPGQTQLTAMIAQNPKLVSVELGSNEVLGAQLGLALVGPPPAPILSPAIFAAQYSQLLDRIEAEKVKHVLLVGVGTNLFSLPAFRTGAEIATQAPVLFAGFNVAVQPDCATTNAANVIALPFKLGPAVQAGLTARALGQPPVPFSCAGAGPTTVDFVITPAEQAIVTAVMTQINATIQAEAAKRGWAFFSADVVTSAPGFRPAFNVQSLFQSATPFGPYMSLDGLHPNAAGQSILAQAAARALNETYDLGIPTFSP